MRRALIGGVLVLAALAVVAWLLTAAAPTESADPPKAAPSDEPEAPPRGARPAEAAPPSAEAVAESTRVLVLDSAGRPAAGCPFVVVGVAPPGEDEADDVRTGAVDPDGVARLSLEKGAAAFHVDCRSRGFGMVSFTAPAADARLDLEPALQLIVHVTREDGTLVAGAKVELAVTSWSAPWMQRTTHELEPHLLNYWRPRRTTGPSGDAELSLPPMKGWLTVTVGAGRTLTERDDFEPGGDDAEASAHVSSAHDVSAATVEVELNQPSQRVDVELPAGAVLEGTVVDASGVAVAGASLKVRKLVDPDAPGEWTTWDTLVSDRAGAFRVEGLPPRGPLLVTASTAEQRAHVRTLPRAGLVLRLSPTRAVTGRVVDEGSVPVPLFFANRATFRDPQGRFRLELEHGVTELTLSVLAQGFARRELSLRPGAGVTELGEVVLERGRTVRGVVVDAQTQAPVSHASVEVAAPWAQAGGAWSAEVLSTVRTDDGGRFELKNAPTTGVLHATAKGYRPKEQPVDGEEVRVTLEKALELKVVLFEPSGARQAMVVQATAVSPAGELITATGARREPLAFEGLTPGTWRVSARGQDCVAQRCTEVRLDPQDVAISAGQRVLTLRASAGAEVRLQWAPAPPPGSAKTWVWLLAGRVGLPPTRAAFDRVHQLPGRQLDDDGVFHAVAPGVYTVFAWRVAEGQRVAMLAEVTVGAEPAQQLLISSTTWVPLAYFEAEEAR